MSNWGEELWDRYPGVYRHVTSGWDELVSVFAKYVKERGEVENEYAKNIRKLVTKYTNKLEEKSKDTKEDASYTKAFRLVLQETGFQAGQHEVLGESLAKIVHNKINEKGALVGTAIQKNNIEKKQITEYLEKHHQSLDKAKKKYQKSLAESTLAKKSYLKADANPTVSRNEIVKLKYMHESLLSECEEFKHSYASELLRTNKYQAKYYNEDLPAVINNLHNIEIDRIDFVKYAMDQCVAAEKQVAHIIEKCRDDMENAIHMIDPVADSELLINRLKTGVRPPDDLPFEETPSRNIDIIGGKGRKRIGKNLGKQEKNTNLFSKKKKTEENISLVESQIKKGYTEIKALRVMIKSYTQNPSFGDVKTFQEELDSTILKVQKLEADLHSLNLALKALEHQLEEKKCIQKPVLVTPTPSPKLSVGSTSSAGYGTINSYRSSSDIGSDDGSDGGSSINITDIVCALYSYDGQCGESSIAMIAGELFTRLGEDEDGWTKVRRRKNTGQRWEGFVPTSYLTVVKS